MLLALSQQHPLVDEGELQPTDLMEQDWISVIHKEEANSRDNFVGVCVKLGFTPNIKLEAGEAPTALGLVAAGLGLTLIQHSLRHNAPKGVVLRVIPWMFYTTQLWAV